MKIAATQINCEVGEIQKNLDEHYRAIKIAIKERVQLIIFPEMSITGYCREEGKKLAFTEGDIRLNKLQKLAIHGNIIIVVGAPIKIADQLYIGAFVIYPDNQIRIYTKQYLHDGEESFYSPSMNYNPIIQLENEKISLAICADINNEKHPYQAAQNGTTIYLSSIFYSENGINAGHKQLEKYAKKYALTILMSNYSGELWNIVAGGNSAFWNLNGDLVGHLNSTEPGILIAEKKDGKWGTKKQIITTA